MFSATSQTISEEMMRIQKLRNEDPACAQILFQLGEQLVSAAKNGELSRFRRICSSNTNPSDNEIGESKILLYFVTKAFQEALLNDHLMLATFIVQNGFPIKQQIGFPNFLHECLCVLDDHKCVPVVNFFVNNSQNSGGFDINYQAATTWLTPLHIAVRRLLSETVRLLISLGADVNAVAEGDLMPLNVLQAVVAADGDVDAKRSKECILDMLMKSGAKASWRRVGVDGGESMLLPSHSSTSGVAKVSYSPGISTVNPSFVSNSRTGDSGAKKVRFTGGGGPIQISNDKSSFGATINEKPFVVKDEVENEIVTVFTALQVGSNNIREGTVSQQEAVVTVSDDGGMLFSTGS